MTLLEQIDERRREIRTDGYSMSIGEWISLYEKNELDIHPEFQRFFRWTSTQKTNLIESILLGIPIPPIFVSQRADGVWDVVDGLQRLSTLFQFVGILKDAEKKLVPALVLTGTKYLPALGEIQWLNVDDPKKSLPTEAQLTIKRSKIAASIILKESDENAKYDLFQRLNTGGSELSPQEVRNCLLVMLNKTLFEWITKLAKHPSFVEITALSERLIEESYDLELVLRFLVLFDIQEADLKAMGDIGAFLTDRMTTIATAKKYPYGKIEKVFKATCDVLAKTAGDDAFKRYSKTKERHEGGFLVSLFEVVALGIGHNIKHDSLVAEVKITRLTKKLWADAHYTEWAGSGITASTRVPKLVPLGRQIFSA